MLMTGQGERSTRNRSQGAVRWLILDAMGFVCKAESATGGGRQAGGEGYWSEVGNAVVDGGRFADDERQ